MPVSKKRMKDGKPVHRKTAVPPPEDAAQPHGPQSGPVPAGARPMMGRPSNPFIAQQRRGSQRGR